jgi:hypothetical protein
LPQWRLIHLKPAKGFAFRLKNECVDLQAEAVPFEPLEVSGRPDLFGVRIYFSQEVPPADRDSVAFLLLSTGLGERRFATEITHVETAERDAAPPDPLRLGELDNFLEWRRRQ